MKKLYVTLALVLCLVLCVFAFASCDKKGKKASTTAAGTTDCAHAWGDFVVDLEPTCADPGVKSKYCTICGAQDPNSVTDIEPLPHTEVADYTVDTPATCSAEGYESKHCAVCGQIIASTVRKIDKDPKAHVVESWVTTEPTLLAPDGNRSGVCKLCNEPVNEAIAWTPPMVYLTNWDAAARAASPYSIKNPDRKTVDIFGVKTNITKARGNGHYYPDESNENVGNDLLVEFSFLYNETMANATQDATLAVMNIENHNVFNIDLKNGKITARIRTAGEGGPDEYLFESPSAVSHAVSIGEYGWHRFAMRMSQTAEIKDDAVKYTVIATAYLDGVKIFEIDKTNYALSKHNKGTPSGLLYTATIEDDKLVYKDLGSGDAHFNDVYIMVEDIDANASDPNAGYVVVADFKVTCGQKVVQNVEPNATPAAADNFVLDDKGTPDVTTDDVTCPAKIYYQAQ